MIVFVGDIHSNYEKLCKVVNHYGEETRFVFLGDINDSRLTDPSHKQDYFLGVYRLIHALVTNQNSVLIKSNHQKNLCNVLKETRTKTGFGMKSTLDQLQAAGYIKVGYDAHDNVKLTNLYSQGLDLREWLDARPLFFSSREYGDVVTVHAQYDPLATDPYNCLSRVKDKLLYGSKSINRERIQWWNTYKETPYVVAGHYHEVFQSEYCSIIDGGCGNDGGELVTMEWPSRRLRYF